MACQTGLHKALITTCAFVPFGSCICGRAAQSKIIVHADCIDDRHEITFEGNTATWSLCCSSSSRPETTWRTYTLPK